MEIPQGIELKFFLIWNMKTWQDEYGRVRCNNLNPLGKQTRNEKANHRLSQFNVFLSEPSLLIYYFSEPVFVASEWASFRAPSFLSVAQKWAFCAYLALDLIDDTPRLSMQLRACKVMISNMNLGLHKSNVRYCDNRKSELKTGKRIFFSRLKSSCPFYKCLLKIKAPALRAKILLEENILVDEKMIGDAMIIFLTQS